MMVTIRDEGWDRPMYGTFGKLPKEAHTLLSKYNSENIEVYKDFDRYQIDISDEDHEILTGMHKNLKV